MADKTTKKVPCPNCEGTGFLNDAAAVGWTTPCPVCLTEGVLNEEDAVYRPRTGQLATDPDRTNMKNHVAGSL